MLEGEGELGWGFPSSISLGERRTWLEAFFKDHAITSEVGFGRPYVRYTADDPSRVREAYHWLDRHQRSYMTRLAVQDDGVVIVRHAPPGLGLPHVFAELRPDNPVRTGPPRWHYHPSIHTRGTPTIPEGPSAGRPLSKKQIYTLDAMTRNGHIARSKNEDDHSGTNCEDVHKHQPRAKYLFPPAPTKDVAWAHDHAEAFAGKTGKRAEHVSRRHGGVDVAGRHVHSSKRKDESANYAKRLDLHPLAQPRFEKAKRVFFVIEGCIKADAVLSTGEAVFSVPSVTLWDAPELPQFIEKYLQGKEVVIVPDADWFENAGVKRQAILCRSFLRLHGLEALVAAPPIEGVEEGIKGVDDFLAAGNNLDDLVVIDREVDVDYLEWLKGQAPTKVLHGRGGSSLELRMPLPGSGRRDGRKRSADVVEAIALHADDKGTFSGSLGTLARVMGMQRRRVPRGLDDLLETGAATVDKPLATQSGVWHGNYYDRALEWVDRPTITVHPDLRAKEWHRPLGKCVLKVSHMKGTPMDAAEIPLRTVERLTNLERDVALLKEDLGIVSDEEARDTVERFLGSIEDRK
jgi:hypothetical protein